MARSALAAIAATAILGLPVAGLAAQCPPGERGVDARPTGPAETFGEETVTLLGAVRLGQGIDNRVLRLRRITLAPGAQVGWHAHGDRSLLLFVEIGTYTEYRSDCRVPIRHRAGDTIEETIGTRH